MIQTFLFSLIFPVLSFLCFYLLYRSPVMFRIRKFRIQGEEINKAQLRHEMLMNALYPFLSTVLVVALTAVLSRFNISRVYYGWGERSLPYFLFSAVLFVLVADCFRYWSHRMMHSVPFLYRNVHSWHHRSVNVNPLSTLSMHPLDLLSGTPWILATNLFPVHVGIVIAYANFYHFQNLHRHLGYDFWGPDHLLGRFIISPRNHDLHHTEISGNYGATFVIWDKLFGTALDARRVKV